MASNVPHDKITNCGLYLVVLKSENVIKIEHCTIKPTKWPVRLAKTQISLGICPVWSESSLFAQQDAKALIKVFAGRICYFVGFVMQWLYYVSRFRLQRYWNLAHCRLITSSVKTNEPPHDETNTMACAPSEDSDQPEHPPSLIRLFAVHMKKAWILSYPLRVQRRLWSDWADAQTDLSLRWAHSNFVGFVMRRPQFSCSPVRLAPQSSMHWETWC